MNDIEQRIRELPLTGPTDALDRRIAALLSQEPVARPPVRSQWTVLIGTALAAGIAGFAAGLGTGQRFLEPRDVQSIAESARQGGGRALGTPANYVRLIDSRVSAGLDFSQTLEPFHVQLTSQEGSERYAH